MGTRGPAPAKQTLEIKQALLAEHERVQKGGGVDWGFRARLAEKYGVSRARVSTIARTMGLTDKTRFHPRSRRATGSQAQAPGR